MPAQAPEQVSEHMSVDMPEHMSELVKRMPEQMSERMSKCMGKNTYQNKCRSTCQTWCQNIILHFYYILYGMVSGGTVTPPRARFTSNVMSQPMWHVCEVRRCLFCCYWHVTYSHSIRLEPLKTDICQRKEKQCEKLWGRLPQNDDVFTSCQMVTAAGFPGKNNLSSYHLYGIICLKAPTNPPSFWDCFLRFILVEGIVYHTKATQKTARPNCWTQNIFWVILACFFSASNN